MHDDHSSSAMHEDRLSMTTTMHDGSSATHGDPLLSTSTMHDDQNISSAMHDNQNWAPGFSQPSIALKDLQQPLSLLHGCPLPIPTSHNAEQTPALDAQDPTTTSTPLNMSTNLLDISALDAAALNESFNSSTFWEDFKRFVTSDLNSGRQTTTPTSSLSYTDTLLSSPSWFDPLSSPSRPTGQFGFLSPIRLPAPMLSLSPCLPAPSFSSPIKMQSSNEGM